jgi:hypothetical protein
MLVAASPYQKRLMDGWKTGSAIVMGRGNPGVTADLP